MAESVPTSTPSSSATAPPSSGPVEHPPQQHQQHHGHGGYRGRGGGFRGHDRGPLTCFNCGQIGHKSMDCREPHSGGRGSFRGGRGGFQQRGGRGGHSAPAAPKTEIQSMFAQLSAQLDDRNDRRERIIKISRDITRSSKKVISLLQRATQKQNRPHLLKQASADLSEVHQLIGLVQDELAGSAQEYWIHERSFSPGIQEYIEAVAFWHYINDGSLVTKATAEKEIAASLPDKPAFSISMNDFLLGLTDLTGELMRFATNAVSMGDSKEAATVCDFMRTVHNQYQQLKIPDYEIGKKMAVMQDSIRKVETVCYKLQIRSSEFPAESLRSLPAGAAMASFRFVDFHRPDDGSDSSSAAAGFGAESFDLGSSVAGESFDDAASSDGASDFGDTSSIGSSGAGSNFGHSHSHSHRGGHRGGFRGGWRGGRGGGGHRGGGSFHHSHGMHHSESSDSQSLSGFDGDSAGSGGME